MESGIYHNEQALSHEMDDVIDYRPHWLVRRGNSVFLILVLGVLLITWLVRYPDVIKSSGQLVASNPPKQVTARTEGKFVKLLVREGDLVETGQYLGVLESTADWNQVLLLQKWVNKTVEQTNEGDLTAIKTAEQPLLTNLGELQGSYQLLQDQLAIVMQTFETGYFDKKRLALQRDMQYLSKLQQYTKNQKKITEDEGVLEKQEYDAYEKLAKEKVIAPLELNQYKSKLLGSAQNLDQIDAQITRNEFNEHTKRKELLELQKQVLDENQLFRSRLLQLKSETEMWKQKYILVAPDSGNVIFAQPLVENQLINIGKPLFYIQPVQSTYYLEMLAGQVGFGKIKKNQKVIVRVDGYPSEEFGSLAASIDYISLIPNRNDSFALKANLQDGLKTNNGRIITFKNNLTVQTDIITDERRLIDRFLGQLGKIWK